MRPMPQTEEPTAVEQSPLAWPTVDPDIAISMLVQEAELLVMRVETHMHAPAPVDDAAVRDLYD